VKVRFRSEAAADVASAREWYDQERLGLGQEFGEALEHVVDLVADFPDAFPEIAPGLRRAILRRFPYSVYYRVSGDIIEVVACLHNSRSPDTWTARR
jgi:plasmid stabilization system protein ParE